MTNWLILNCLVPFVKIGQYYTLKKKYHSPPPRSGKYNAKHGKQSTKAPITKAFVNLRPKENIYVKGVKGG